VPEFAYDELAKRITHTMGQVALPTFDKAMVRDLARAKSALAGILGCEEHEVFGTLFDADKIRLSMEEAGLVTGHAADAEVLWLRLCEHLDEFQAFHQFGDDEWGMYIESEEWLNEATRALPRLRDDAGHRGWPPRQPMRWVAAHVWPVLSRTAAGRSRDVEILLGPVAIVCIRRAVLALAARVRRDAVEFAQAAAANPRAPSSVGRLPGWIEAAEAGMIPDGLRELMGTVTTVAVENLLEGARSDVLDARGDLEPDSRFAVTVRDYEVKKGIFKKKDVEVGFEVVAPFESGPQVVLHIRGMTADESIPARQAILAMRAEDLAAGAGSVGERLLRSKVPVSETFEARLAEAMLADLVLVARTLVLLGTSVPLAPKVIWEDKLNPTVALGRDHDGRDTVFDGGPDQVLAGLREQYREAGVEPVEVTTVEELQAVFD